MPTHTFSYRPMKLVTFPDPRLSKPCPLFKPVKPGPSITELESADRIRRESGGVAIAANQVGSEGSWWLMEDDGLVVAILNPVVTPFGPEKALLEEGCLSFPGHSGKVPRHLSVRVSGTRLSLAAMRGDVDCVCGAKLSVEGWHTPTCEQYQNQETPFNEVWFGLRAQIAQHEFDHLNGICYTAHLSSAERSRIHGNMRKLKRNGKL